MAGSDTSAEDDKLDDAKEAFKRAQDAWSMNQDKALEDFKFARLGEQWPEQLRRQRGLEGRPVLTINRLPAFIRQVTNDARQNKPSITVHPVDDLADPDTVEVYNGLIRHIERSSDAEVAYDTALDHAATGGFGFFGINTRYTTDDGFEQDIVVEAKPNCFSIIPDPDSTAADSSDWNDAWELEEVRKAAFEQRWKDADPVSFDGEGVPTDRKGRQSGELIRIGYRWLREASTRQIVALKPPSEALAPEQQAMVEALIGEAMIIDVSVYEAEKALFDSLGFVQVGQPRTVATHKVKQCIYSGADLLDEIDWAGKFIPLVPVYGEEINVEGARHLSGLVRMAKDPQRMFNYWRSASTELVALAPKAPWIGDEDTFTADPNWATANTQSHQYLMFTKGATPPQRQPFAGIPAGAIQEALNASDDMKSIMGLFDASLGAKSNETSGRAIMARQREGDVSTFHFIDNLSRAIRHAGRIMLDLIPKVYSTPRVIRIIGGEGDVETVRIAPKDRAPAEQEKIRASQATEAGADGSPRQIARIYVLDAGKYDLTVSAGPSFTSRREEAATQMIELIRAYPAVAPVIGDLLAKNLDWPGADEIAERLKAMLPAQLRGENAEAVAAQAQIEKMAQLIGQLRGELEATKADRAIKEREINVKAYGEETKRLGVILGKDGGPYDVTQAAQAIISSLMAIQQSPDILEGMANGGDPAALAQLLAQRMAPQQAPGAEGGAPPAVAAA